METVYKVLLLFGSPGVGKGTQGAILGHVPGLRHLATGDMFRGLDRESELGREVVSYSSRGELVPDELTVRLWTQHVQGRIDAGSYQPATDLLLLDGIPRSTNQAAAMDDLIEVLGIVHLVARDIDAMVERMKRRALSQGRQDDADETVIRRRFEVYQQETSPVLAHYPCDLVHDINAMGTPIEVLSRILDAIVPICRTQFGNPLGK